MRTLEEIEKEIAQTQAELENVQGTETEVYARIVGYYRAVRNWNQGKRDEFNHRKMFQIENAATNSYFLTQADSTCESSQTELIPQAEESTAPQISTPENGYYEIYTRKTCPNCPPVKEFMKSVELTGKAIDVDSEEGLAEAAGKGVFAAPTVIVYDAKGSEIARGHSVEELTTIFSKVPVEA